ncbi:hypothetical protein L596_028382 [Steinernema carpocapsae]|uniref:Uncharacterized protein n=1 Tax=Steinernema carpocapsae TaxID=34508 RepID=A0A4U5LY96_STECR|nr:hypothetical protein L596_028382 [Steinernema carpocapsae]
MLGFLDSEAEVSSNDSDSHEPRAKKLKRSKKVKKSEKQRICDDDEEDDDIIFIPTPDKTPAAPARATESPAPASETPVPAAEAIVEPGAKSDSEESYISIIEEPEVQVFGFATNYSFEPEEDTAINMEYQNARKKLFPELGVTTVVGFLPAYDRIKVYRQRYQKAFRNFDKRIWEHYQNNSQNDQTFAWKMRARRMIHEIIQQSYPSSQLVVVGSTLNGCGSFNSDLDMCLCVQDVQGRYDGGRSAGIKVLSQVVRTFARARPPFMKDIELIRAKVPILKFYMNGPYEELEIDLNCNNIAGIYNTHLMHHYSRIDDRFGALCLLIKHWAINNDIQDAMTGTFNSYSLILMVLHFLQSACSPPVLPNLQDLFPEKFNGGSPLEELQLFEDLPSWPRNQVNEQSIGELLIGFFEYYSEFDFENIGISINRGDTFMRTDLPLQNERYKLYVEEPFDGLNTARCVTKDSNFSKILNAFARARNAYLDERVGPPSLEAVGI